MPNPQNIEGHKWKKGQSGNQAGRPAGSRNRATMLREWLGTKAQDGFGGTMEDQIIRAVISAAAKGEVRAFQEIMDSIYGKIKDEAIITHTFTKMGEVKMDTGDGKPQKLSFNVGKKVEKNDGRISK